MIPTIDWSGWKATATLLSENSSKVHIFDHVEGSRWGERYVAACGVGIYRIHPSYSPPTSRINCHRCIARHQRKEAK